MRSFTRLALVAALAGIMLTPTLSHAGFGKRTNKIMTQLKAVHKEAVQTQTSFVDEDGDGVCDLCGNVPGSGAGANFIDEDGDGVCDNYGTGVGTGFVDEDGDGVCDNCGSALGQRSGGNGGSGYRAGEGKGDMDRDRLNDGTGENCPGVN